MPYTRRSGIGGEFHKVFHAVCYFYCQDTRLGPYRSSRTLEGVNCTMSERGMHHVICSHTRLALKSPTLYCLGGAAVRVSDFLSSGCGFGSRQGRNQVTRSTQPSIPPGYINRVPALPAEVKAGCVRLCRVASNIV